MEVKERQTLPEWILEAIEQAESASDFKTPVAILHQKGMKHQDDLVVMRLKDFLKLQEEMEKLEEQTKKLDTWFYAIEESER